MAVSIRRKAINAADCPVEEFDCSVPTDSFKVEVLKNDSAEAKPVYVHVYGLPEDEELLIGREYTSNCDPLWEPLTCGGQAMALGCGYPDIMLVVPGTYVFKTKSGCMLHEYDFAVETCPVHAEYADLWLKQQQLCCCRESR